MCLTRHFRLLLLLSLLCLQVSFGTRHRAVVVTAAAAAATATKAKADPFCSPTSCQRRSLTAFTTQTRQRFQYNQPCERISSVKSVPNRCSSSSRIPQRTLSSWLNTEVADVATAATATTGIYTTAFNTAISFDSANESAMSIPIPLIWAIRVASLVIGYIGAVAWVDRPQGQLYVKVAAISASSSATLPGTATTTAAAVDNIGVDNTDSPTPTDAFATASLQVAPSTVPGAGLGVFATTHLPKGTILGTYPGVVLPLSRNVPKLQQYPSCEGYIWRFSDNLFVIDPTNNVGVLDDTCRGGSRYSYPLSEWLFQTVLSTVLAPVATTLCRINEPPRGKDVNVVTSEDCVKRTVTFALERDVEAGEELFIDYGLSYDRSKYGG